MKRSISRWTMAATAAALLAVPATGAAQTSGTSTPQTQSPSPSTASQPSESAREHLSKAQAALNDVKSASLNAKARAQLTELKKRMAALERATNTTAGATAKANAPNWGTEVAAIFYSLIETSKLNGVDPKRYLKTALTAALAGERIPLPHELLQVAARPADSPTTGA